MKNAVLIMALVCLVGCAEEDDPTSARMYDTGALSVNAFAAAPNVIFILADDIGYSDVGAYNEYISGVDPVLPTRNINRLAQEGMMFTDAHSPAVICAPTRYAAMTGNYPYRGRVPGGVWPSYAVSNILPGQTPIAATMRSMGYRTAFIGKWNIGAEWYDDAGNIVAPGYDDTTVDVAAGIARGGPVDQGFDYSFNLPFGIQNSPYAFFENNDWYPLSIDSVITPLSAGDQEVPGSVRDGKKGDSAYNSRDVGPMLASKAVDFIDDHLQTHPGSPFLLYYSSQAVHIPHTPSESLDGQPVQGATGISDHADLIHELDLQVGAIISKLELEGILDQTLIIFTSDNGGLRASEANGHYSNLGLRGHKGQIYEGGHRVPFIVRWPGVVLPGSLSHQTIVLLDWVATMYDMLGIPMGNQDALDAVSILPVLAGLQDENDPIRDRFIVQDAKSSNEHAIRDGDDILIYEEGSDTQVEFYNLASDLLQTQNLLADPAYQSRITEMDALYQADQSSSRTSPALDYSDPNVRTQWGYEVPDHDGDGVDDHSDVFPKPIGKSHTN